MKLSPIQFWLFSGSISFSLLFSPPTRAQIVPDTTLGNENSVVTPNVDVQGAIADLIEGGAIRDANLFHSFLEFNIGEAQRVYFSNPQGIANILTRVTGSNISEILGTLGVNGNANLFLINPNGIIFGEDASLDIGGSFLASTANSINLADGFQFSATASQTQPLLTVSAPVGLGFGEVPGSIVNQSLVTNSDGELTGLQVQPGETLALIGGDLFLEGGILSTEGGQIELGSVADNNLVSLTSTNQGWRLGYEDIEHFQDITLFQGALVGTSGDSGGDIEIQGRRVKLTEGSQVISLTLAEGQAGNLRVSASESLELVGGITFEDEEGSFFSPTGLLAEVEEEATGEGATLTIETGQLIVKDGATVSTTTFGEGQGVDLTVSASESVELLGSSPEGEFPSGLFAQVETTATGDGGTLTIETRQLIVKDGAQVSAATFGAGRAGDLTVSASELVKLEGTAPDDFTPSGLFAQVEGNDTGNAGNLTVETQQFIVKDGAQISSAARNGGQGGIITVNASDFIQLSGTSPNADLEEGSSGIFVSAEKAFIDDQSGDIIITTANSGDLKIETGELIVEDGARISADTFGTGDGGTLTLDVKELIIRDGGQIGAGSRVEENPVNPLNRERGVGGTVTVNASESVEVTGSGTIGATPVKSSLFARAEGTGNAGNLNIFTPNLTVRDGAEVTVSATGEGEAGSLKVEAESIRLDDGSLSAQTRAGDQGNITLKVQDVILRRGSEIITNAILDATGGNITINTDILAALEDSDITARAIRGRGGNITITTQGIFLSPDSDVNASSQLGISGTVTITTPEVDPTSGILELPSNPIDAESIVAKNPCAIKEGKIAGGSSFVITGRGGLPPSSDDPLPHVTRVVEWVSRSPEPVRTPVVLRKRVQTNAQGERTYPVIEQAQGWMVASDDTIMLTATPPNVMPQTPRLTHPLCR
ncbi:MAG: S-layer family protein [Symploca sp. SIO3C6]|nr:S-layer family protein [Symploca sp. SIO3C6]